jgi:hypothetical protein
LELKAIVAVDRWLYWIDEVHTIDRDILHLPEVIIESYDISADEVLRPCFDSIWNACGFAKDLYYNDTGKWVSPK